MGAFLTTESQMSCPHGGQVMASTENTQVQAESAYVLRASDTFTISGCSFVVPPPGGPGLCPCTQVEWVVDAEENTVTDQALNEDSVGLCIGPLGVQGVVLVDSTQTEADGL